MLEFKFLYFLFSCPFSYIKGSLNISAHLSMKIILVDCNLVRNFLLIIFLIRIKVRTLKNNYFLVRTELGYLRYQELQLLKIKLRDTVGKQSITLSSEQSSWLGKQVNSKENQRTIHSLINPHDINKISYMLPTYLFFTHTF